MRASLNILALVGLSSLFAVSCSPTSQSVTDSQEAEVEAIRQADLAWVVAQEVDGLEGTMSVYLDDAIMLPPNAPMAIGKEAIREASAVAGVGSPGFSVKWEPIRIEVARSGEIGYAIGTFEGTAVDAAGNLVPVKGKYVEIWKKQPDGSWMVAADMFSPDSPPDSGS